MNEKEECVFCKIVKEELEADIPLESEHFIAMKDIDQTIKGHTLIIPKEHIKNVFELPQEHYEEFLELAKATTQHLKKETGNEAYNYIINNGTEAGQAVMHLHLHVIPRRNRKRSIQLHHQQRNRSRTSSHAPTPTRHTKKKKRRNKYSLLRSKTITITRKQHSLTNIIKTKH